MLRRLAVATVFTGGVLSWFASTPPDGLEWSVAHAAGSAEIPSAPAAWPAVDAATSLAGVVGGLVTLVLVLAIGLLLRRRQRRA
jgi:cobalt/nickel transport system permease protein